MFFNVHIYVHVYLINELVLFYHKVTIYYQNLLGNFEGLSSLHSAVLRSLFSSPGRREVLAGVKNVTNGVSNEGVEPRFGC